MNLLSTSIWSLISTGVKLVSGLIVNKFISVYVGPVGLGLIGQIQNLVSVAQTISSFGLYNGVTKYTAEYSDNTDKLQSLFVTCFTILTFFSLSVGLILVIFSKNISVYITHSEEYASSVVFLGLSIPLFTLNQFFLSILNGLRKTKLYFKLSIFQSFYGLLYTILLLYFFKLNGALIAITTNQAIVFFNTLYWFSKTKPFPIDFSFFNFRYIYRLSRYSIMTLSAMCCYPVAYMMLRNYIGKNGSWDDVGIWQAMMYISTIYLMVASTVLSTYFLPVFSKVDNKRNVISEIKKGVSLIFPAMCFISFVIYFSREYIVEFLFYDGFEAMIPLFKWQLLGDIFKILTYVILHFIIAKALVKEYVFIEIFGSIFYFFSSALLFNQYGLIGVMYSHFATYVTVLIVVSFVFYKKINSMV